MNEHFSLVAGRTLDELDHWIKAMYGAELLEVRIRRRDGGWFGIIKCKYREEHLVGFFDGKSVQDALVNVGVMLNYRQIRWKPDLYPPHMGD